LVDGNKAGIEKIGEISGNITVKAVSGFVLKKER